MTTCLVDGYAFSCEAVADGSTQAEPSRIGHVDGLMYALLGLPENRAAEALDADILILTGACKSVK